MKIQWLGHSSFRIVGSKTVVTDPYGGIGLAFPEVRADIVTVSHGHFDHNAVESVGGEPAVVDDAGMHKIADVTVMGYNTAHDDVQGAKRGGNIIYLITMDGYTIAHLGDLGCMPDHSVLGALEGVDVLLIPVGGNYTIDGAAAAAIVAEVHPRTVTTRPPASPWTSRTPPTSSPASRASSASPAPRWRSPPACPGSPCLKSP